MTISLAREASINPTKRCHSAEVGISCAAGSRLTQLSPQLKPESHYYIYVEEIPQGGVSSSSSTHQPTFMNFSYTIYE